MNDLETLQQVGRAASASEPAIAAAREALLAEMDRPQLHRRRFGLLLASVGAACVTGAVGTVLVTGSDQTEQELALVEFQMPTFPYSFSRELEGLRQTEFERSHAEPEDQRHGTPIMSATYGPAFDPNGIAELDSFSRVTLMVTREPWPAPLDGWRNSSVNGRPARFRSLPNPDWAEAQLWWQDKKQWIGVMGLGTYASEEKLRDLAALVVNRQQPIPVRLQRAPAGWELHRFITNEDLTDPNHHRHNVIRLEFRDPKNPERRLRVFFVATKGVEPEKLVGSDSKILDAHAVTIRGLLFRATHVTRRSGLESWVLSAQGDGPTYTLEATPDLTAKQVAQIAEAVVWE